MVEGDARVRKILEEVAGLRRENVRLKREIEFKNNNILLLHRINANMRAALRTQDVHFMVLSAVTAGPGLGLNRAALFAVDPDGRTVQGAMAIGPDTEEEMHRIYEDQAEKGYKLDHYIEQYYKQNLTVSNKLHERVRRMRWERSRANFLNEALEGRTIARVPRADPAAFSGAEDLGRILEGEFIIGAIGTDERELGVVVADNHFTRRPIEDDQVESLRTLCEFAASMIVAARRYEEAEQRSIVDDLTRLHNRRYLEDRLREEVERGRRYKRTLSLLLLDVDDLGGWNEREGHLAGNKALMDLADLLRGTVRSVDTVARTGGGEFAVLLPETPKPGGRAAAEKLLERIRRHRFVGATGKTEGKLTVSGGVASFPEDGADDRTILSWAEACLYRAKANGKNRFDY